MGLPTDPVLGLHAPQDFAGHALCAQFAGAGGASPAENVQCIGLAPGDVCLVPLIFETYADDLAERTAALSPKTVLETAAGSGVVARALASRLASDARYAVTDLNRPMLDHAANRVRHAA